MSSKHISELEELIAKIPTLRNAEPNSVEHTRWVANVTAILEDAFGLISQYKSKFTILNWDGGSMVMVGSSPEETERKIEEKKLAAYLGDLQRAEGILIAACDELKRSDFAQKSVQDPSPLVRNDGTASRRSIRYDVFLSYASDNSDIANELKEDLEKAELSCFLAEKDLKIASLWEPAIREALLNSANVLLLLTPESMNRPWVLLEAGAAWALGRPIVPALSHVKIEDLPEPIKKYQGGNIHTSEQRQKLIEAITGKT